VSEEELVEALMFATAADAAAIELIEEHARRRRQAEARLHRASARRRGM
jgi:hypothetical protein